MGLCARRLGPGSPARKATIQLVPVAIHTHTACLLHSPPLQGGYFAKIAKRLAGK